MGDGKKIRSVVMVSLIIAAVFSGVFAATATADSIDQKTPIVSTRGHFEVSWWDVDLTDGHTPTDYDTSGDVPGVDTSNCPSEIAFMIHGWMNDASDAKQTFADTKEALRKNGYDGPVVGYSWDSDTGWYEWYDAKEIAKRNGKKLAAFTADYKQACPNSKIHYVAHSLGGKVMMSGLQNLNSNGEWNSNNYKIDSVHMLGTAVENEKVSTEDGSAGYKAISEEVRDFHNYYKTDDNILQWLYSIAEIDNALGESGADGNVPDNYHDHDVTDAVPDHFSYYEPGEGVIGRVLSDF